jgi:exodeoxyribonuclease V alpha subunit
MCEADNPAAVFDYLEARGLVDLHGSEIDREQAIAEDVLAARQAGRTVAVIADTREQAARLNAAIRDRLVTAGLVDDRRTGSGCRSQQ